MQEIDIWRAAQHPIQRFGEDASIEAALRADQALDDGTSDSVKIGVRVMRAVEDLQRLKPENR